MIEHESPFLSPPPVAPQLRLAPLVRYSQDGVLVANYRTGLIVDANARACAYLGSDRNLVVGRDLSDLISPADWSAIESGLQANGNGHAVRTTPVVLGAQDRKLPMQITTQVDAADNPPLLIVLLREVGDSERAQAKLRKTERLYNLLAGNLLGFIWAVDRKLQYTYVSPSVLQVRGYTDDEAMQQTVRDSFTPESYARLKALLADERERGAAAPNGKARIHTLELEMTCKGGGTVWTEMSMSVYRRESGRALGFLAVSRDISDRKEAEQRNSQLQVQIQQAQKLESLGILAGGIAHDFNNLLTGVLGYTNLLQKHLPEGSPAEEYATRIETATRRANVLTKQMLAYSGRGTYAVRSLNVSRLVDEISHLLEVSISKKAELIWNLNADIPRVQGDPAQLQQVVMNLITNASDALGEAAGTIALETGAMEATREYLAASYVDDDLPPGPYVYVRVSDDGCGMDRTTISRIFDPFFTTKFTGRGLGLAAVLGIIRSHGGAIRIDSAPGRGSSFTVLLPAQSDAVYETPAVLDDAGIFHWRHEGEVLVIDDETVVLEAASQMLRNAGMTVTVAHDPRQGVEVFASRSAAFDVVLLDVTMPNLNGTEVLEKLRAVRADVPVVLMSGYDQHEVMQMLEQDQIRAFIQKPFGPRELLTKVRDVLG